MYWDRCWIQHEQYLDEIGISPLLTADEEKIMPAGRSAATNRRASA